MWLNVRSYQTLPQLPELILQLLSGSPERRTAVWRAADPSSVALSNSTSHQHQHSLGPSITTIRENEVISLELYYYSKFTIIKLHTGGEEFKILFCPQSNILSAHKLYNFLWLHKLYWSNERDLFILTTLSKSMKAWSNFPNFKNTLPRCNRA